MESSKPVVTLTPLTLKDKILLVSMGLTGFSTFLMLSVISPFYPSVAIEKGATLTEIGLVFGVYELGVMVTSLIFGNYMPVIGAKFAYLAGTFVRGVADILFSLLIWSPDGRVFVIMCIVTRIVEAAGAGAFATADYTIAGEMFGDRVSSILALLQTFMGLGFMAGPPLGGLLYSFGGFQAPFIILGSIMLALAAIGWFLIPSTLDRGSSSSSSEQKSTESVQLLSLVRIPSVMVICCTMFMSWLPYSLLSVVLEIHLKPFELSPPVVGLVFLCQSASYAVVAPICGHVADRYGFLKEMQVFGYAMSALSCFLIGPSPILGMERSLEVIIVALLLLGVGMPCMCVPLFKDCVDSAAEYGYPANQQLFGLIAGLTTSLMYFGAFLAPVFGAEIVELIGFAQTMFWMGVAMLVSGCLVAIFVVCQRNVKRKNGKKLSYSAAARKESWKDANLREQEVVPLIQNRAKQGNNMVDGLEC